MGTRGLVVYRHKGTYYVLYSHSDSYAQYLGMQLVSQIPTDKTAFEAWLEVARNFFEGEARKFKKYEDGRPKGGDSDTELNEEMYAKYYSKPSRRPPSDYEWTYTLDLDLLAFSINDGVHFRLNNIPRGEDGKKWIYYLTSDGYGKRCLRPDTPRKYVVTLVSDVSPTADGLAHYETFASDVNHIREDAWLAPENMQVLTTGRSVASIIVRGLIMENYCDLSEACRYPPYSDHFQAMATLLVCAAAPGSTSLTGEARHREIIYSGYLKKVRFYFRRTESVFFRFRGCIILLTDKLESREHLRANVGLAVSHARETGVKSCTVLILSILYVAVAVISVSGPELRVSQSDIYPVLAAYGNDEEQFSKGLGILTYYLRPHCMEDTSKSDPPFPPRKTLFPFELPVSNARKNTYVQDPSLPYDILIHIMSLVDSKTYDTFQFVSKVLRREWAAHPRILDYTIAGVAAVNMQTNAYLPDVTLNARTRDGLSTSLAIFCTEMEARAFDSKRDNKSCLAYPSPYADRERHWKPLFLHFPYPAMFEYEDYLRLETSLFILDEGDAPESCPCCRDSGGSRRYESDDSTG
ncbi:hypothetical protein DFH11DRAFT_390183 [Phellopilus nigrolimitatus]|nr:hypothetical protein DFH11DRAFT_390183 [Phellopilus nigrolimitatus]